MSVTWSDIQAEKRCHPKHIPMGIRNTYGIEGDIYGMSDEEFRKRIVKRRLKNKKITKEEAFIELL